MPFGMRQFLTVENCQCSVKERRDCSGHESSVKSQSVLTWHNDLDVLCPEHVPRTRWKRLSRKRKTQESHAVAQCQNGTTRCSSHVRTELELEDGRMQPIELFSWFSFSQHAGQCHFWVEGHRVLDVCHHQQCASAHSWTRLRAGVRQKHALSWIVKGMCCHANATICAVPS